MMTKAMATKPPRRGRVSKASANAASAVMREANTKLVAQSPESNVNLRLTNKMMKREANARAKAIADKRFFAVSEIIVLS